MTPGVMQIVCKKNLGTCMQSRFFYILDDPLLVFHKLFLIWYLRNVNMVLGFSAIFEYFHFIFFVVKIVLKYFVFKQITQSTVGVFLMNSPFARIKVATKPSYFCHLRYIVGEFGAQKNSNRKNFWLKKHTYQGCHES